MFELGGSFSAFSLCHCIEPYLCFSAFHWRQYVPMLGMCQENNWEFLALWNQRVYYFGARPESGTVEKL